MRTLPTLFTAFVLLVTGTFATAAEPGRRPNVLLIVGDDMGYADVGFHGCKDIPTPNLDALAAAGVRFTNGYVTGPYCSPTRAGLLTGRYQQRFGHEFNAGGGNEGLPVDQATLADRLKSAGYATSLVGKWHLGSAPQFHPQKRGFDEFFGFLGGAHDYFNPAGFLRGTEPVKDLGGYATDAFGREAVSFVERHKNKPWFLYLAFNAVHTPMQAPDDLLARFGQIPDKRRRAYAAMMWSMDAAIGRVRAKLVETGQERDTLVMFVSDNGGPTMPGVTQNGARNDPLRGSKRTTLEGGVRVPFVVAWPGKLTPGVYDKPVVQLDLFPTALAAAGVEPTPAAKLDGVNLLPFLGGGGGEKATGANGAAANAPAGNAARPHDALYWRFGQQMAIRAGDHKLVRYDTNADTLTGAGGQPVSPAKLYDLASDPGETKDLAAAMPEKVKELQAKWDAWNAGNVAPLWGGGGRRAGEAGETGEVGGGGKKRAKKKAAEKE